MQRISEVWPEWQAIELIGEGAYGKVYRASRTKGGYTSEAAIKIIDIPREASEVTALSDMGMDTLSIRSFFEDTARQVVHEIEMMDSLKGAPNVVGIEDYELLERSDGVGWTIFIRMELLEGLPAYLQRVGMPDVRTTASIGAAICRALGYCHSINVIHRDVKPENIFVTRFGEYKLGDFGLSRRIDEGSRSTKSLAGSGPYMAPEMMSGHYDARVDIYALGIMLYRWLNGGRPPFIGAEETPTRATLDNAQHERITGKRPPLPGGEGVPSALAAVVRKAVEPDPDDRWQSAGEFGEVLQAWLDGKPVGAPLDEDPGETTPTVILNPFDEPGKEETEHIRISDVLIKDIPDQLYEVGKGAPVCPPLEISYEGEPLELGVDYTASYSDNEGPGVGTVVVRGLGWFKGQKTLHFRIDWIDVIPGKPPRVTDEEPPDDYTSAELKAIARNFLDNHEDLWKPRGVFKASYQFAYGWHLEMIGKRVRKYFGLAQNEPIYLLVDSSSLGTSKEGILITGSGLVLRDRASGPSAYIGWEELRKIPDREICLVSGARGTVQVGTYSVSRGAFGAAGKSNLREMVQAIQAVREELVHPRFAEEAGVAPQKKASRRKKGSGSTQSGRGSQKTPVEDMVAYAQEACRAFLDGHPQFAGVFKEGRRTRQNLEIDASEQVFLIHDEGGGDGFAITEKGFACRGASFTLETVTWDEFISDECEPEPRFCPFGTEMAHAHALVNAGTRFEHEFDGMSFEDEDTQIVETGRPGVAITICREDLYAYPGLRAAILELCRQLAEHARTLR